MMDERDNMSPDIYGSETIPGEKELPIDDDATYNFMHNGQQWDFVDESEKKEMNLEDKCGKNCCCLSNDCTRYNNMMKKLDTVIKNQEKLQTEMDGMTKFFKTVENAVHAIERCFHHIIHLITDHLNMSFENNQ
ncbi:uncharacterized protein LOC107981390 [Nasonia vitripennis]|uniref:Uncharacterized protein n=1 Tax=Nasonia vitripennis TaxID=7425 RepID=A0A7M7TA36_NASVI|nr:uncharacterized protein LOC107981390 [Nasonia vitripennis]